MASTVFNAGNLLISHSVYTGTSATVPIGSLLPNGAKAVADGSYPYVWGNEAQDASFGITSPIFLDQLTTTGTQVGTSLNVTATLAALGKDLSTSFPSKSELGLNRSADGQAITFFGYSAPVNKLDVSNSNTPGLIDPSNPASIPPVSRTIAQLDASGNIQLTPTNAYSGNNGRAVALGNNGFYYTVGNAGNGGFPIPDVTTTLGSTTVKTTSTFNLVPGQTIAGNNIPANSTIVSVGADKLSFVISAPATKTGADAKAAIAASGTTLSQLSDNTGVQMIAPLNPTGQTTVVGAVKGTFGSTTGYERGFSIADLGLPPDKTGKDDNFRGLTINPFDNSIYVSKGSGGNGVNTVYKVTTPGGETLPTLANAGTSSVTILPGFSTTLASSTTSPITHPFGLWFANATTLYVADEGTPLITNGTGAVPLTDAVKDPNAGLEKWSLVNGIWKLDYVLQNGLDLGKAYTVANGPNGEVYPTALNPATTGLRNITGKVNADGTVSIYAVTSTASTEVDQGADPNRLVAITDNLAFLTADQAKAESFTTLKTAAYGEVLRGVTFTPNGAPVAAADAIATTEKAAVTGNVLKANPTNADTDPNNDPLVVTAVNGVAAAIGTKITLTSGAFLTLNTDGTFVYDPNGKFNKLAAGANGTDTFTYTISDGQGGTSTAPVTLTIAGVNDPAVIAGAIVGTITEDATPNTVTGALTATDVDSAATFVLQDKVAGTYGNFSIGVDGKWTYNLDNANAATNALIKGAIVTDIFTAKTADGTAQAITITVTGANDAAKISGVATAALKEGNSVDANGKLTFTGALTVADPDTGEAKFNTTVTSAAGNLGYLTINAAGAYSYIVDNSATQYLNAGQTKTDTFTVASIDGSAKQDITINIAGVNTGFSAVAAGDATTNSAILWTRTVDATTNTGVVENLTAQISTDKNFTTLQSFTAPQGSGITSAIKDYTTKVDASGLQSGTQYFYRFKTAAGELSQVGTFKTAYDPTTASAVRFGFSGDADGLMRPYPSLQNFGTDKQAPLDFFVFLGDTIYENVSGPSVTGNPVTVPVSPAVVNAAIDPAKALIDYHRKYLENLQPDTAGGFPGLKNFFAAQGNYTALDNHELGNKQLINGGAPAALATVSANGSTNGSSNPVDDINKTGTFINKTTGFTTLVQAYSDYQPIREKTISAPTDARTDGTQQLYQSQQWGKNVIYINTDSRSYRDARLKNTDGTDDTGARADAAGRTLLGTTQLAWLKQNLLDAQKNGTAWKFVSVSDPIDQIGGLGGADDGGKSWIGGYRAERNELLKFIADNKIDNVVFLACDDHQNRINEIGYYTDITDPKTFKLLPNALSIVDGPIGATGPDKYAADHSFASIKKLADDLAAKQTAAGVNPIGLDPKFMGLSNVKREGDPTADTLRQAVDFYSPDTFNYTTFDISADGKTLNVNVQGIDSYAVNTFPEPSAANPVKSILSFSLTAAQPNLPPVANNDAFTTTEKAPVTGNVFAANPAATGTPDSDANKDPIVVSAIDGKAASVGTEITLASGALLTVKADGNFTYNPNGKFNPLADGAKGTDSFTYTISDGKGGTSTATSTFTITGVNDPAVIAGTITGAVTEDAATNTVTGALTATDVDSPATFVAQDKAAGTYGTFSIGTDGKWTYALDNANPKTNALTAGQKVTDMFTAKTADGTAQAVTINVTGANDLAVIAGTAAVAVTKDLTKATVAATGKLTVTDVDAGEAKFNPTVTPVGTNLGALTIDETGAYSYSVPTTALQSLVSGQTKVETFTVKSFDGSASQNIIATINGANNPVTPAPTTTPTTPTPVPVTASNCFDLRELLGKVSCDSKVSASAAYDNYGGFYTVDDTAGKIGSLKPGDTGYAAAALKRAVLSIHKTDTSGIYQLEGGQLLAPFLVANGNVSDFLSKNASNAAGNLPHAYFNYADANPDKIEHMRSTSSNRYDCEDMFGGGDKDFNDFTLQLTVKPA